MLACGVEEFTVKLGVMFNLTKDFFEHFVGGELFVHADLDHAFTKVSIDAVEAFDTGGSRGNNMNPTVPRWGTVGNRATVLAVVDSAMGAENGVAFFFWGVEEGSEVGKDPETLGSKALEDTFAFFICAAGEETANGHVVGLFVRDISGGAGDIEV